MLPLSEKVKVFNKERKKKLCAEVAKFYGKNKFSIREIVKKEKEIHATFAVTPQTAKVTGTVSDQYLDKILKGIKFVQ